MFDGYWATYLSEGDAQLHRGKILLDDEFLGPVRGSTYWTATLSQIRGEFLPEGRAQSINNRVVVLEKGNVIREAPKTQFILKGSALTRADIKICRNVSPYSSPSSICICCCVCYGYVFVRLRNIVKNTQELAL